MRFITNSWRQGSLWLILLTPLAYLFRVIVFIRKRLLCKTERPKNFSVPIVVIGNISIGGAGKTPLTITIANKLVSLGYKPGIVSRGYKAQPPHYPFSVKPNADAVIAGDEPLLIAESTLCPVVIDSNRSRAVSFMLDEFDVDLILSDDGLQHYKMYRDVEVCVVDDNGVLHNRNCLPVGPLREPLSRLREVDLVVLNGINQEDIPYNLLAPTHKMNVIPKSFVNLSTKEVKPFGGAPFNIGNRIQAITAIANPNRFFETLETLPYPIEKIYYPDHYEFASHDFTPEKIDKHQPVVMTEKDAVKCGAFANNNFWMLTTTTKLEDSFFNTLISKIDCCKKDIAEN